MRKALTTCLAIVLAGCLSDIPGSGVHRGDGAYDDSGGYDYGSPSDPSVDPPLPTGGTLPSGMPPWFGPTVTQNDPPPPISGGTLALAPNGLAVAADPDRDVVHLVDLDAKTSRTVALQAHDEPGRVAIDNALRAHVVLRGAGAIATIDLTTGAVIARRNVCLSPRGIAYEDAGDRLHVACATGELVTLSASGGSAPLSLRVLTPTASSEASITSRLVGNDLRDVVVTANGLVVSTFRNAGLFRVGPDGSVTALDVRADTGKSARVAWRLIPDDASDTGTMMVAQQSSDQPAPKAAGYYHEDPCATSGGQATIVHQNNVPRVVPDAPLAVDVALTSDAIAIAVAGNAHTPGYPVIHMLPRTMGERCAFGSQVMLTAQITSVAWRSPSELIAFSREPAAVFTIHRDGIQLESSARIDLPVASREDTGHAIFHSNSGGGSACASCHPEGGDDGNAWASTELGRRRTPSLLGTLANTAPYHWNGEAPDMTALARLTFESRMGGPRLADDQIGALDHWLVTLPAPAAPPAPDPNAVARGATRFANACASCHAGPMHTDNLTIDVGTGGPFQVPSLVGVHVRPPYLHDGRAPTIAYAISLHAPGTYSQEDLTDLAAFRETF
jgi:hypothetical protein